MLQKSPVLWRENGHVTEVAILMGENGYVTEVANLKEGEWSCYSGDQVEGEWSCYRDGHFNEGRRAILQRWSV